MGIEGMHSAGLGGLEAFQRLRAQAREKLAQPSNAASQGASQAIVGQAPRAAAHLAANQKAVSALAGDFAAAKADILKTAASYQRTGETNKAQSAPRLGQYVDLVA
jgi:hypothetical protein